MKKKRCTNSACRKTFLVDSVCPYCGKIYPRLGEKNFAVELKKSGESNIRTFKALRNLDTQITIRDVKNMIFGCPCIVGRNMSRFEAKRWCKQLEEAGATAVTKSL